MTEKDQPSGQTEVQGRRGDGLYPLAQQSTSTQTMPPSGRRGGEHLVVSSSIRDSTGTLESWATDGFFLSLPLGLCLVLEAGRPVGTAVVAAFRDEAIVLCYHPPAPPPAAHFLLFHLLKR